MDIDKPEAHWNITLVIIRLCTKQVVTDSQKICRGLHWSIISKDFVQYFKKSLKIRIGLLESTKGEEEQAQKGKGQRKKNDWQKKKGKLKIEQHESQYHQKLKTTGATMAERNMTKWQIMIYKALSKNIKIEYHESQYYFKNRKRAKGKRMIDEKTPEN